MKWYKDGCSSFRVYFLLTISGYGESKDLKEKHELCYKLFVVALHFFADNSLSIEGLFGFFKFLA